jgi:hypothetical protein
MSADSPDKSSGRRRRVRFVPGVYNYCDGWCERCRFQPRCRIYDERARYYAALEQGDEALDRFLFADDRDNEEDDDVTPVSAAERADVTALLDQVKDDEPPGEELRRFDRALERHRRLKDEHPLTVKSHEYLELARDMLGPLLEMVESQCDPLADAALEAIGRHAYTIAGKARRATSGLLGGLLDDDDVEFRPLDADGCAKLVRLMIAESRAAWTPPPDALNMLISCRSLSRKDAS